MVENGGNIKGGRSDCASSLHRNSKVQKGWRLLQILSVLWVSAAKEIAERGGVWMTGRCYLDGLKSGRVIVAVLLEHMSCGKTKGAQAVQDGSLEAWAKRILKCGVWNMNEVKTHHLTWIPGRQQSEQRQIWQRGLCPPPLSGRGCGGGTHLPWQQSWGLCGGGSSLRSDGTGPPGTAGETRIVWIYISFIVSELLTHTDVGLN